jgi:hypothetical protein
MRTKLLTVTLMLAFAFVITGCTSTSTQSASKINNTPPKFPPVVAPASVVAQSPNKNTVIPKVNTTITQIPQQNSTRPRPIRNNTRSIRPPRST